MIIPKRNKLLIGSFLLLVNISIQGSVKKISQSNNQLTLSKDAIQLIYQNGVPHTDKIGQKLTSFDPQKSFFPLCLYHAMRGNYYGVNYNLPSPKETGFNCVHTWEGQTLDTVMPDLRQNNLQLIYHYPKDSELKKYATDPQILAWYLDEEPTMYLNKDIEARYAAFQKRQAEIKKIDPLRPVFIIDLPYGVMPSDFWWFKWNTSSDISAHDNYPITSTIQTIRGLAKSISIAVSANQEKKPFWFVVQAFEGEGADWKVSMPTRQQERAMVYAAIARGATGIIYFAYDSWITRDGKVLGIAPNPQGDYPAPEVNHFPVSAKQLQASRKLWQDVIDLNRELEQLKPVILGPTSKQEYQVYLQNQEASQSPITSLLKEENGRFTLLTVNLDNKSVLVKYQFPRTVKSLKSLFDRPSSSFQIQTNSWTETYEPFGVRTYQFELN